MKKVFLVLMVLSLIFIGCSKESKNSGSSSSDNTAKELDGTWEKGSYSLNITGSNYLLKDGTTNVGKGTITYSITNEKSTANGRFTVKSTHYWDDGWEPFQETGTGTFNYNDNEMTILSVNNSSFEMVIGKWTRK